MFSIQKISLVARNMFGVSPGEWFKPNQILHTLRVLHESRPLIGAEDLKFVIFNDGELYYDRLICASKGINYKCEHIQELVESDRKRTDIVCNVCPENGKNGVAFFVVTRLGIKNCL